MTTVGSHYSLRISCRCRYPHSLAHAGGRPFHYHPNGSSSSNSASCSTSTARAPRLASPRSAMHNSASPTDIKFVPNASSSKKSGLLLLPRSYCERPASPPPRRGQTRIIRGVLRGCDRSREGNMDQSIAYEASFACQLGKGGRGKDG
jgi:hypothetical protein